MTGLRAPGVDPGPLDPCECGHGLTDHLATEKSPCDVAGCGCEEYEGDGDSGPHMAGGDGDDPAWRDGR